MNMHIRKGPSGKEECLNMMTAFSDGIDLNNEAVWLSQNKQYEKAVPKFKKAIEIKEKAYGPVSLEVCISLSGLADAYLDMGDYENSYKEARRMLEIATEIGSKEQLRIAREILADVSEKTGKELKKDEGFKPLSSTPSQYVPKVGVGISLEPPTKRCHNFKNLCTNTENLMMCARCFTVMYCSVECQKADWKIHKSSCHKKKE